MFLSLGLRNSLNKWVLMNNTLERFLIQDMTERGGVKVVFFILVSPCTDIVTD